MLLLSFWMRWVQEGVDSENGHQNSGQVSKVILHLVQKQEKSCLSAFANAGQEWNIQSSLPPGGAEAAGLTSGLIQPGCAGTSMGCGALWGPSVPSTPKHCSEAPPCHTPTTTCLHLCCFLRNQLNAACYSSAAIHRFSGKDGNLSTLLCINIYIFSWANMRVLKFH